MPAAPQRQPRKQSLAFWAAVTAAVLLLLISGFGFRTAADRFARPNDSVPLPPGTLAKIPLELGNWKGRDLPLSQAVIKQTDTDDHINRRYKDPARSGYVSIFMAYGINLRDLAPHRPEICYPGAGWTITDKQVVELTLEDGSKLPCQIQKFTGGALQERRITVLNYYIIDGQYCSDVSLLLSKAWRPSTGQTYSAQVQISCLAKPFRDTAEESVRAFTTASAKAIRNVLPNGLGNQTPQQTGNASMLDPTRVASRIDAHLHGSPGRF